jgi:signal transduction histidine kinase
VLLARTFRSSTFRLALIYISLFGATTLLLFWYVYSSTTSYVLGRIDRALIGEITTLQTAFEKSQRSGIVALIEERIATTKETGNLYLLTDASSARLAGNLESWPPRLSVEGRWRAVQDTLPDGSHLVVARDISDFGEFEGRIKIALALCIFLVFALAAVASVSVTRRTVGRIEAINTTTRRIMHTGLGERIPLRGTRDEWDELASNLNSMLNRIEALMEQVKQVSDNLAHDLRTPLSRMRGRLESAYTNDRDREKDQPLVADLLTDLDGVLRMFSSLMRISQIEGHDSTAVLHFVDLREIASEVIELFDAAAEDRGSRIALTAERRVLVRGDRDLLFDAFANLLDNAIKHGRDAGLVTVEIRETERGAVIVVSDDGPGIPEDERENVFRRFYRLERSRCTPGNGLGLSLVAAVARIHGAAVELADGSPGICVQLCFPGWDESIAVSSP